MILVVDSNDCLKVKHYFDDFKFIAINCKSVHFSSFLCVKYKKKLRFTRKITKVMPFTASHIVAILPIKKYSKGYFSITGLVIGSMVPDFEFFLRMTLLGYYGHRLSGVFFFDLPVGLLLYIAFRGIIRKPTLQHLPAYWYNRLNTEDLAVEVPLFSKPISRVLGSIFIGVCTHLLWDGFSHDEENYLARYLTFLLDDIHFMGFTTPLYNFIQLTSSVVGLLGLFIYIHILPVHRYTLPKSGKEQFFFWGLVALVAVLLGTIRVWIGMPTEKPFAQLIVLVISATMYSTLLVSLFYKNK